MNSARAQAARGGSGISEFPIFSISESLNTTIADNTVHEIHPPLSIQGERDESRVLLVVATRNIYLKFRDRGQGADADATSSILIPSGVPMYLILHPGQNMFARRIGNQDAVVSVSLCR